MDVAQLLKRAGWFLPRARVLSNGVTRLRGLILLAVLVGLPGLALAQSAPLTGVLEVHSGSGFSCARLSGGTVSCWGTNWSGQLGDGSTTSHNAPSAIAGLSGVAALALGDSHACALMVGGTVKCWGDNGNGRLGDGTTLNRSTPVDVSGLSGVAALSLGHMHSCALLAVGGVMCWGNNGDGQLGDSTYNSHSSPSAVPGVTGATAIAAGGYFTCALVAGGAAKCWGSNWNGELGDNTTSSRPYPGDVTGLSGATALVAGSSHACALLAGGTVQCWGYNNVGQVGDGTNTNRLIPTSVSGLSGATGLDAGSEFSCAVAAGGTLKCWGRNNYGQLGDWTTTSRSTPVDVPNLTGVTMAGLGANHSCVRLNSGQAQCWGGDDTQQLGNGSFGSVNRTSTPLPVLGLSAVSSLAVGSSHICARKDSGTLLCWGYNGDGQAGTGGGWQIDIATAVPGLTDITQITAGGNHTCARSATGALYCWGDNYSGQIGVDPTWSDYYLPTLVPGAGWASQVAAGSLFTCAITALGATKCWGSNSAGQLGNGNNYNQSSPVDVSGLYGATFVGAGAYHTCALLPGGSAKCWGRNSAGELGNGSSGGDRNVPVDVSGLSGAAQIVLGGHHSCSLMASGGVKCWGDNYEGQLGFGYSSYSPVTSPIDVPGLSGVVAVVTGGAHTCALLSGGTIKCWGDNYSGQLGNGSFIDSPSPVDVVGITGATAVAAGGSNTCAVVAVGGVKCWGNNYYGQLGLGVTSSRAFTPQTVISAIPDAPNIGPADGANGVGKVRFSPPSYQGSQLIDTYRATCSPGGVTATGSASPISVSGLSTSVSYTCTVAAHNAAGWSAESSPSNAFTPINKNQRVFVSAASGNDANTVSVCAASAPCRTFGAAASVTLSGGEVVALASGEYGPVTLIDSIALIAAPGIRASITATSGAAVVIDEEDIAVALRGLSIVGAGGSLGVGMYGAGRLSIERCQIHGFTDVGILVDAPAQVTIADTLVRNSGNYGAALINGVSANIAHTKFLGHSLSGILIGGDTGSTATKASISNTVITGNGAGTGIAVQSLHSSATVAVGVNRSTVSGNLVGVEASSSGGAAASLSLSRSRISGNDTGLKQSGTGAVLRSRGNNTVSGNNTATSGTITPLAPQ
ncbi:hypothetical protein BURK2_02590 [Burkholderiales bacterium]|nr:hypothetical protein BURK2_02590 [Burkholderiales bacterium]